MNITHARFIRKDEGVEMIAIPLQFLQSHRRMVHVEHLKLAIHVTCREDQVSLMRPLKALGTHIVRLHVPDRIVPSAICSTTVFNWRIGSVTRKSPYCKEHFTC